MEFIDDKANCTSDDYENPSIAWAESSSLSPSSSGAEGRSIPSTPCNDRSKVCPELDDTVYDSYTDFVRKKRRRPTVCPNIEEYLDQFSGSIMGREGKRPVTKSAKSTHRSIQRSGRRTGCTSIHSRARRWRITINNFTERDEKKIQTWPRICKYRYQIERGDSGTDHIQGILEFKDAIRFSRLKTAFPRGHFNKCFDREQGLLYVSKTATRVRGPYNKGFKPIIDIISRLRPWQETIYQLLYCGERKVPILDNRKIIWVYDLVGNSGKTAFARFLRVKHKAILLAGSQKDCFYALKTTFEADPGSMQNPLCVFYYPRSHDGNYISYNAIESVRDGLGMSTKYESGSIIWNPGRVLVLANTPPEVSKLSLDRWVIYEIVHFASSLLLKSRTAEEASAEYLKVFRS